METMATAEPLDSVHMREVEARMKRRRPLYGLGMTTYAVVLLVWSGFPLGRIALGAAVSALVIAFNVGQMLVRHDERRATFHAHLALTLMKAAICGLTGGLSSPFVPGMFTTGFMTILTYGKSRETTVQVTTMFVVTIALAFLPERFVVLVAYPWNVAITAGTMVFTLGVCRDGILMVMQAKAEAAASACQMREDVLEQVRGRARSVEQVSAKVAHELKNPLAAIKGLVQLLARGATEPRAAERLAVIEGEVTRMEGILQEYLSFTRPLEDLRSEPVELGPLARDVAAVLEARAETSGVSLSARGNAAVVGDRRRLKEALLNLVSNAIEATPPAGKVGIVVEARESGAEVRIEDTGRGLDSSELERVGTPFYTTREGGTGLGVVLARSVVVQHGGELSYQSIVGRGTTVRLCLPARPSAA